MEFLAMMPTRNGLGLLLALLALALFSPASCYNPSIQDGGFQCADAGKQCPDGFVCADDGKCRSSASQKCSVPAIAPLCSEQPVTGAACNPTCQTGCACGRCNVFGAAPACVLNIGTKKLGDVCNTTKDDCQPGFICLLEADTCGQNIGRCYQYCTTNTQCASPVAGRTCEIPILDSNNNDTRYKTCSLGSQTCNPMATTNNGCPNPGLGCYVNTAGTTFCDCPNRAIPVVLGGLCTAYNDCAAGLICTPSAGLAGTHCRQICQTSGTNTCPSGQHCVTVAGGFGYCLN
jgi:hypothetical protein